MKLHKESKNSKKWRKDSDKRKNVKRKNNCLNREGKSKNKRRRLNLLKELNSKRKRNRGKEKESSAKRNNANLQ